MLDKSDTASGVWADTAYRSAANEEFMAKNGFVSHVHRKKPKNRVMPEAIRCANNAKSKFRSRVEHVLCRAEGSDGTVHPHDRHRSGHNENRLGHSRRQHQTAPVSEPNSRGMTFTSPEPD